MHGQYYINLDEVMTKTCCLTFFESPCIFIIRGAGTGGAPWKKWHTDLNLGLYLDDANLRMAKLLIIAYLLIYSIFCLLFSLVLHTRILWLLPFRLRFWNESLCLNNCKMRRKQRTLLEFAVFAKMKKNGKARIPSSLVVRTMSNVGCY